jgi:two-component system CheB/CheR fusion protein
MDPEAELPPRPDEPTPEGERVDDGAPRAVHDPAEDPLPGVNVATPDHDAPASSLVFPIVGIGASAGGVEAFKEFFSALPSDTGMAFVVIPHLMPTHQSMLAEILQRSTSMQVREVEDNTPVQPDHVYVIPPGKMLVIGHGLLQLSPRVEGRGQHHPIDHFLRSLAEEMGHKAIGVILSGTADDGTLGMLEIKAAGGITFAQDDTAEQTSMPRSAIAAGCVDFVLPPGAIATEIGRISHHPYVQLRGDGRLFTRKDPEVMRVIEFLRQAMGVDFSKYKYNTLQRRITRRMVLHKLDSLQDYVRLLMTTPTEVAALYQDILISVTSFFRNPDAYEALKTTVFPALLETHGRLDPLRVWALGCSTGEEAYSIAIAFTEYVEATGRRAAMQVFATDLNGVGIEKARSGIYSKGITQDVSPERLRRFFVEMDGSYRIAKPIRDMCVFARQNVLADPPFSRIDLVACRNMLIYLDPSLQQRLIPLLHYAIRSNGFLWLGASETIGSYRDLFELRDARHKIYQRKPAPHAAVEVPSTPTRLAAGLVPARGESRESVPLPLDPTREADRLMLARYAPPGVLLDEALEILQFRGDTSPYLCPAPGKASHSLLKMLREGLLVAVRGAIHRAKREETIVREEGLRVRSNGVYRAVDVVVMPVRGAGMPKGSLLLLFEEPSKHIEARARQIEAQAQADADAASSSQVESEDKELARAKQELAATREYLQSVIGQQEAANEELQSANEELQSANEEVQSANEELQSINEELETSKEEIQSSNEELATVNQELHNRHQELSQSNNDLVNLLNSVQMPIVMLGPDLRIRRFTPAAERLLHLIPTDVGRPMADIQFTFGSADLEPMLTAAMDTVSVQEREVQDKHGRWYLLRVRPYRTLENKIEGAVLMLVDVDALKRTEQALRESEARFEMLADSAPVMIWINGLEGCQTVNRAYEEFTGTTGQDLQGFNWTRFVHPEDRDQYVGGYLDAFTKRQDFEAQFRFRRHDGVYRWVKSVGTPRVMPDGEFLGYVGCTYDITDLKEAEARLHSIDVRKNEFLAVLSHELRNPLSVLRNAAHILGQRDSPPEAVEHAIEVIERQAANMARLVDDLLDVARITQSKIQLRRERVDLAVVLRHSLSATEHLRREAHQELKLRFPARPLFVEGDPTRLDQVFTNLLSNASKFTPANGHIWVALERDARDGHAAISVRDDGEGIDPDSLPRIFDAFVQGRGAVGRQVGIGVGLTLAKHLVELHGGTVEAASLGLDSGSEFTVRLPLAPPPGAESPPPSREPRSTTARRVLIVDDNVDAVTTQRVLLERAGHAVEVAYDAEPAVAAARSFRPEIVLLDIGLPSADGYSVARRLRAEPGLEQAFIVALTGFGQQSDVDRAHAAGIDRHIAKPADPDGLLAMIGEWQP